VPFLKRTRRNLVKKRVLIVDDEANLLIALEACLRAEGYEVVAASDAAEALMRLTEAVPDLIVSDIRMPGTDGFALARHLRASPRTKLVPIVFLTARDSVADRIEGFKSGVDAYLTKPFEYRELVAVVASILERVQRTHAEIAKLVGVDRRNGEGEFEDSQLTDAERRVADAVARGLMNKEIAAELGISVRTVEHHISHILTKKNFGSRVDIARHVYRVAGRA
jgi:DNA-binding NarL/FixJ family response regulator